MTRTRKANEARAEAANDRRGAGGKLTSGASNDAGQAKTASTKTTAEIARLAGVSTPTRKELARREMKRRVALTLLARLYPELRGRRVELRRRPPSDS